MFKNLPMSLGQYRPTDSFMHRLDARASLVPIVAILVLSLLTKSAIFYVVMLTALVVLLLLSKVGFTVMVRNFRPIVVLVAITFAYHLFFSGRDTGVSFRVSGLPIYSGAIRVGLFYSLRLLLFVSVAFLMTLTNSPSELSEAFIALLRPLKKLRVPINDLGLIVFIAMRFIPVLHDEFVMIKNAQVMRGVSFAGNWLRRVRQTTTLLIPVFAAAMTRADELALAIQARGYDSHHPRTTYTHARFGLRETLFASLSTAAIVGLYFATRSV